MRKQKGFTLVEIAIVLVIIGLLLGGILRGQELIQGARVRNVIDQQNGIRAAYFAFQDRFRLVPGDIGTTQTALVGNGVLASTDGASGNGQIAVNDSSTAFQNLTATGFLSCSVCTVAQQASTASNSPTNVYGGVLQLVTNNVLANFTAPATFGLALPAVRTNIKTGNLIPSNVMAEIDLKADDGNPYNGNFRFSTWAAAGGTAPTQATCANGPTATASPWNNGQASGAGGPIGGNCGGGTIIN
ncbi:MAG: prepilin-type N-terminal cleavage/methylation domain-containing protein [Burkholderiales bacterium]|nr:prepilin-type N-terminal cleavage/methylation domain-containing protein [Burkholderiales bacterium]